MRRPVRARAPLETRAEPNRPARPALLASLVSFSVALAACSAPQEREPEPAGEGEVVDLDGLEYYTGDDIVIHDPPIPPGAVSDPARESPAGRDGAGTEAGATSRPPVPERDLAEPAPVRDADSAEPTEDEALESLLESRRRKRRDAAGEEPLRVEDFTLDDERAWGELTARAILERWPLVPVDHPASVYVRKVGALLAEHTSRPGLRYTFAVVESDARNALSAPYGYVFVTTELLRFLESEAELAFILAHEIAHVELRHGLSLIALRSEDIDKRELGSVLDGLLEVPEEPGARELRGRMYELADLAVEARARPHELAADERGARLAAAVGYDLDAATALLLRLMKAQGPRSGQVDLFRTHPHLEDRYALVERLARRARPGAVLGDRYSEAVRQLEGR